MLADASRGQSDRGATQPTLADLQEGVTTFEDTERIARRVFGGAHPVTTAHEKALRNARAALRTRETPPAGDTAEGES